MIKERGRGSLAYKLRANANAVIDNRAAITAAGHPNAYRIDRFASTVMYAPVVRHADRTSSRTGEYCLCSVKSAMHCRRMSVAGVSSMV